MKSRTDDYSLAWIPLKADHPFIARTSATDVVHVPVFLSGDDLKEFRRAGVVRYSPPNIFVGVLLGLQQKAPTIDLGEARPVLKELLELISNDGRHRLEELALSAAAKLREEFGNEVSMSALRTARELLEGDARIASDYMMDGWMMQERMADWDKELLAEIAIIGNSIELGDIDPEIRPLVAYVTVLALSHLDQVRADEYWRTIENLSMSDKFAEICAKALRGTSVSLDEARFLAGTG